MDWSCDALAREYLNLHGGEQAALWEELSRGGSGCTPYDGGLLLKAGRLFLDFQTGDSPGLRRMGDLKTPRIWADANYRWGLSLYDKERDVVVESMKPAGVMMNYKQSAGGWDIRLSGRMLDCRVEIQYHVPADGLWLDEKIAIRNCGDVPAHLDGWNFGPSRRIGFSWTHSIPSDLKTFKAYAIPWVRTIPCGPETIQDFDIGRLCHIRGSVGGTGPSCNGHPSEAWGLMQGQTGMLVIKYSPSHIEYSVLRNETREMLPLLHNEMRIAKETRSEHLVFGGSARCHSDPSPDVLRPGESLEMGLTRYQPYEGGRERGFALFRGFMEERGCGLDSSFDPPVHWNELYDNHFNFLEMDRARYQRDQKENYSLNNMLVEAEKARQYHCDALYLDPGWDTVFASSVWNEERLGSMDGFVKRIRADYGLKVAIHTPLAGWCDASAYPAAAALTDKDGIKHAGHLCSGSRDYLRVKAERLRALAQSGVCFLMFDGTFYTGPCHDSSHGHEIPYTRDAHLQNYLWLARQVHEVNPNISIEMHDGVVSGIPDPYVPVYLGYGKDGFNEAWGWEMMWDSMKDLVSGAALALYWYNLAYSIPIYLHIDLKKENENCLMFWWFASTCRHLGIGGTHANPAIRERLMDAMKLYQRLKPYYARGTFTGLGECAHLHTLFGRAGGVLNLFNLDEKEKNVHCEIPASYLGTKAGTPADNREIKSVWEGETLHIECSIPAMGARVIIL